MIKLPTLLLAGLVASASFVLFHTSYEVQALDQQLGALNQDIRQEQEAIRVLRAEWAYLNQPARLRTLGAQFSPLAPVRPSQVIAAIEEIPMPLPGAMLVAGYPMPGRKPASAPEGTMLLAGDPPAPPRAAARAVLAPKAVATRPAAAPQLADAGRGPVDVLLASFRQQQEATR
jgi:hypothetical protein